MRYLEDKLQQACVKVFNYQFARRGFPLHHSPNEGARTPSEGGKNKNMGVYKGWPDLEFMCPTPTSHGLFLELKSQKGRLSDEQKATLEQLSRCGYRCVVIRSVDQFMDEIRNQINEYDGIIERDPDTGNIRVPGCEAGGARLSGMGSCDGAEPTPACGTAGGCTGGKRAPEGRAGRHPQDNKCGEL